MKRRDFLKVSAGALVSLPKEPIGKLPEGFKVDTNLTRNESWFLSTPPVKQMAVDEMERYDNADARMLQIGLNAAE